MGSTRRRFTDEYKANAVALVLDEGKTIAETARNIDMHEMTLGKWVKKAREARDEQTPPDAPLTESERAELQRLRQENKDVKAENAHLQMQVSFAKKVATWFAKDQQ
ncbi:transposase [Granulicoccus sp. GXG6511]|uniref:transposase n=1 Tax=Granulicoccus sp. GXG6511 TaxID=3381351 RepID=UPI003D7EA61E